MEFAAQYQQTPVPIGGNLIKWSWFKSYETPPTPQSGDKIIVSWDTALSSSQLADYSACVVLLARRETIYILDVLRARLEYPDLKRTVLQHHHRWRHVASNYALLIENKGSGLSLIQDLRRAEVYAIGVDPDGESIQMAIRSCVWPLKLRRSRRARSIALRRRRGSTSSRRNSSHSR
jgi:phage terminase large subunit-like protein